MNGEDRMLLLNATINGDVPMIIVNLGVILLVGFVFGRLFETIKIPSVTGYLVAGLVLGPITGFLTLDELSHYSIVSDLALGFIAFQVGNELWFGKLKKSGMKIVIITVIQAVLTTTIVILGTMFIVDLSVALILGAIAAATAPAPIMLIIKKYRTKGDLTDTVVPVVGLDDAVGVVMFGVLLAISIGLISANGVELSFLEMIKEPVLEIVFSIGIGAAIGLVSGLAIRYIYSRSEREEKNLNVINITVLLTTGLAFLAGASPILTPMIAGTVVTNLINKDCYVLEEETIRFFIPPLMVVFFTIAGAQLQLDVVFDAGLIGLVYIVGRAIGKFFGAYMGASLVKSPAAVKKFLGISLLPQSGVAIGLSVAAFTEISAVDLGAATVIKNVILASVLFFALTGPILVKISLFKAGEIRKVEEEKDLEWKNSVVYQN
jgi:Kef-type K+ transport system membrane component KefB